MPLLTEQNLEKLSSEVVDAFFKNAGTLTDGVVKIAERESLNPEQIKRLVEAVNNMTFQRKFSAAEGTDRMDASQFETADPNSALQRLIQAAQDLMEEQGGTASMEGGDPCTPMGDLEQALPNTRPEQEPFNPAGPEDNYRQSGSPKISSSVVGMKLRKTAELLNEQQYQHRVNFTECFQKLATQFTRLNGTAFEAFEKDAFYKWGERAVPYLTMLRGTLRKPAATYDHGAMTKVARVIDSSQPCMRLFAETMQHSENVELADKGLVKIAEYLKNLNG